MYYNDDLIQSNSSQIFHFQDKLLAVESQNSLV